MRKLHLQIAVLGVMILFAVSCRSNENATAILNDPVKRGVIYAEILNNHSYMKQLIDSMRSHDHARMMILDDTVMMNTLFNGASISKMTGHLIEKSEKDSSACKLMCETMMDHKKTRSAMLETLSKEGAVSKDCMMSSKSESKEEKKTGKHH